ncbi:hypothetical protein IE53DRAFT_370055 [Violaceomyces palustris]|uniref:Uncharacterized protein n=1 Tax=Violaceomyces palustris TaxID=1673888 RepID=A0ACD0NTF7_9BASI|nr:hypothetical protein IE53DRAFT_370055 [Violaceomyces palustris]
MSESSKFQRVLQEEIDFHMASTPIDDMPSCTNLFDKWASCFAIGPQLKAIYRYGGVQDCKDKLDDFKFCLTMKSMTKEQKYQAWITRRAEITASKRLGPQSSENVWEYRRDDNVVRTGKEQSGFSTVV